MYKRTDEQDVGISPETAHLQETNHHTAKKEFQDRSFTMFLRNHLLTLLYYPHFSIGQVLSQHNIYVFFWNAQL